MTTHDQDTRPVAPLKLSRRQVARIRHHLLRFGFRLPLILAAFLGIKQRQRYPGDDSDHHGQDKRKAEAHRSGQRDAFKFLRQRSQ